MYRFYKSYLSVKQAGIALIVLLFAFCFNSTSVFAQDGEKLFTTNCASCHNPVKDALGPALKGTSERVPSRQWLYDWIRSPQDMIANGDEYANKVYEEWNKIPMTPFPHLTDAEIDAIVDYVDNYEAPVAAVTSTEPSSGPVVESNNTLLFTLITVLLAVVVLVIARINRTLKKIKNNKSGITNEKDVPLLKNKIFIATSSILLFILAGYWMVNGAVLTGVQQNYMPEQPIFYSHKVHAGINQINCLYCHTGADKSRQAMIPSTNVCMNCHMQIDEYTGEDLYTYEGELVDGTAEIHKLYEYAGWDHKTRQYKKDKDGNIQAKPVKWVKVHNLPDFVYFNHSQHVAVGQIECQTCHGDVTEMDEIYQFSTLNMGWCVNCHRTTEVQFTENSYYSIYEKYQQEIKEGKRTGVTAADVGATDCAKCHY